jgi:hypothetical protein
MPAVVERIRNTLAQRNYQSGGEGGKPATVEKIR